MVVTHCAVFALASMSPDSLVFRVKEAAQVADWEMLHRFLRQYLSVFPSQAVASQPDPSSPVIASLALEEERRQSEILDIALQALQAGDFQMRWDLSKTIPNFGDRAIAPLIDLLDNAQDDDDWELTWFVARMLGHYPDTAAIAALRDLLKTTSQEDIRAVAIDALASMGDSAISTLAVLADDPSTRLSAVQALAQIHHPDVVDILISVVQDDDVVIRSAAIATLGHLPQPGIQQLLIDALRDPASPVRCAAVIGLGLQHGMMSAASFVEVLTPLLWDINLDVRRQTILALGRLKSKQSADMLFTTLCSPDTPMLLSSPILRALVWTEMPTAFQQLRMFVTMNQDDAEPSHPLPPTFDLPALNQRPNDQPSFVERFNDVSAQLSFLLTVATTLGLVEKQELQAIATDILIDILTVLHDNDEYAHHTWHESVLAIKQAIAYSLGHLKQRRAVPVLQSLLNDDDKRIHLHTVSALEKIVGTVGSIVPSHEM